MNWEEVIQDAVFRRPPFERGKSEKGFRDRLIAESYFQLLQHSPKTPSVCKVVLVTSDGLLADAVGANAKSWPNSRVLRSFAELQDLVNTLVSSVTEEFVVATRQLAQSHFFDETSKEGLFFTASVRESVQSQYSDALKEVPSNADTRENGTWYIGAPTFVGKKGQRMTWSSPIQVETVAYKYRKGPSTLGSTGPQGPIGLGSLNPRVPRATDSLSDFNLAARTGIAQIGGLDLYQRDKQWSDLHYAAALAEAAYTEKVQVAKGKANLQVLWSVTITAARRFKSARLEKIELGDTDWE